VKAGSAVITVTDAGGSISAVCTVTVKADAKPVTGISVSKSALSLSVGAATSLTVSYRPVTATIRSASWVSNNQAVARVEPNGRVVAISTGTAIITAISDSGAFTAACTVTVTVPVESVSLPETSVTLKVGETYQLEPIITPSDAAVANVTYTVKSTTIATVTTGGLITARRPGTTTVTVSVDGKAIVCTVTVIRA